METKPAQNQSGDSQGHVSFESPHKAIEKDYQEEIKYGK